MRRPRSLLAALILLALLPLAVFAQGLLAKSTGFSTGTAGQPDLEAFSFYLMRDGSKKVSYAYGADWKEVPLTYLGPKQGATPAFSVRFPNRLVLEIEVQGDTLRVRNPAGGYDKVFRWQYEGPVDGIGTFCDSCVEESEAPGFVTTQFAQ